MKALRELLIRMDSMDTRLGNYGENLRNINGVLFDSKKKPTNPSLDQSAFHRTIDQLTLDDSVDPLDRSRSCNDTSFFEVLDDINSTINQSTDKFTVGNKRVQIVSGNSDGIPNRSTNQLSSSATTGSTSSATAGSAGSSSASNANPSLNVMNSTTIAPLQPQPQINTRQPGSDSLKVARKEPQLKLDEHQAAFYVTPFAPDQTETAIQNHICEITNVDPSMVKIVKLIPRGKDQRDLTFVSFKATVPTNVSKTVGDQWYWPEGVEIRAFEPREKNFTTSRSSENP